MSQDNAAAILSFLFAGPTWIASIAVGNVTSAAFSGAALLLLIALPWSKEPSRR